jgi:hypothetical protein
MQFKPSVPDQGTGPRVFRQVKRQHKRGTTSAHRQDDPPCLDAHRLSGPVNRVEPFGLPGILHAHCGVFPAQLARRLNCPKKDAEDRLH